MASNTDENNIQFAQEPIDDNIPILLDSPAPSSTTHLPRTPRPGERNPAAASVAIAFPTSRRPTHIKSPSPDFVIFTRTTSQSAHSASRNDAPPDSYDCQDDEAPPPLDRVSIDDVSRNHASVTLHDTPKALGATRDFPKGESVKIQGKSIMTTLGVATVTKYNWVIKQLSPAIGFSYPVLHRWLGGDVGATLYNFKAEDADRVESCRWVTIPECPALEADLYEPYMRLISTVLQDNHRHGPERQVVDTHTTQIPHFELHRTSPDIVIIGTGSSFQIPSNRKLVGYANVVAFIDIKLYRELTRDCSLEQLAVYARQVFVYQPNRWFVRGMLASESHAQMVQFDRAGTQLTPVINIHDEPEIFTAMLLTLTTTADDRNCIGLDNTIQWVHDEAGRKIGGTLTIRHYEKELVFDLVHVDPVAHNRHIRGSATICWKVRYPKSKANEEFLVKDSWSSEGRTPEWQLLRRANKKGIRGVCRMVCYEERIAQAQEFRCADTRGLFFNRAFSRLVVEADGLEIQNFKDRLQLLRALRDAIAAHGNLYGAGILHRDISNKTILLGREDAKVGDHGILIDLSVAFDYHRTADDGICKEPILGPRFFQACGILDHLTSLNAESHQVPRPAHDYLDDLESFFFVLCYLVFGFHPDGKPREDTDRARSVVEGWDNENAGKALAPKNMLLNPSRLHKRLVMTLIGQSWGTACKELFGEFLDWVAKIQAEKARLFDERLDEFVEEKERLDKEEVESELNGAKARPSTNPSEPIAPVYQESIFAPLYKDAQAHYDHLLDIFTKAIGSLRASPDDEEPAPKVVISGPDGAAKRRRVSSVTSTRPPTIGEQDLDFKMPDLPKAAKTQRLDEQGNGAAWMSRTPAPTTS